LRFIMGLMGRARRDDDLVMGWVSPFDSANSRSLPLVLRSIGYKFGLPFDFIYLQELVTKK